MPQQKACRLVFDLLGPRRELPHKANPFAQAYDTNLGTMAPSFTSHDATEANVTGREHGDMRDYMSTTLFQPHRVRDAMQDAYSRKIPLMLGYYAGLASVPITRWVAPMGFDYVWIDWEHSAMNIETMTTVSLFIVPLHASLTLTLPRWSTRQCS